MSARESPGWMGAASCVTRPDLPWIVDAEFVSPWDAETMRAVCAACPARLACLAAVETLHPRGGWWAGADRDPLAVEVPSPSWVPVRVGRGSGRTLDHAAQGLLPLGGAA